MLSGASPTEALPLALGFATNLQRGGRTWKLSLESDEMFVFLKPL